MKGRVGISLFSGAGGLDLGLHRGANVDFRAWVEIDPDARATLKANFNVPEHRLFSDITAVEPAQILAAADVKPGDAFVVAGGPPCQAFSTAGKRQSVADPRGRLVDCYFKVIEVVRPRFFVFENVRGLLSAAIRHRPLEGRTDKSAPLSSDEQLGSVLREVILPAFTQLGYAVAWGLVDAADYGTPQRRARVIFLGSRDDEFAESGFGTAALAELMPPTHGSPQQLMSIDMFGLTSQLKPWVTLGESIQDLPTDRPTVMSYSDARKAVYHSVPAGQNWRYVRDSPQFSPEFLRSIMGGALDASGGRVGFWRRLAWDEPAPTLVTSPVQKATGLCHPTEDRPLSVEEYKRIQQFPDGFELRGSIASQYRQLGNAVPTGLAESIGRSLVRIAGSRREALRINQLT